MSTFGDRLRQERESREIPLSRVAHETKIGRRYLEALEANEFEILPGGAFNKGYVRTYAQYLGIDPERWIGAYSTEAQARGIVDADRNREVLDDLSRILTERSTSSKGGAGRLSTAWKFLLPIAAGIALVAGAWLIFGGRGTDESPTPADGPTVATGSVTAPDARW